MVSEEELVDSLKNLMRDMTGAMRQVLITATTRGLFGHHVDRMTRGYHPRKEFA
jgi:hypothetical protein